MLDDEMNVVDRNLTSLAENMNKPQGLVHTLAAKVRAILEAARKEEARILVLGAFGCGAEATACRSSNSALSSINAAGGVDDTAVGWVMKRWHHVGKADRQSFL